MTLEQLTNIANKIHKQTNNLVETGRILRDKYLILSFRRQHNTKLSKLISCKIPDNLYIAIKNIANFKKHMQVNSRDLSNKIKYKQACQTINIMIHNLKIRQKILTNFLCTPELSQTILSKYSA